MGSNTRSSEAEPLLMKIVTLRATIRVIGDKTGHEEYDQLHANVKKEEALELLDEILDDVYDALV